MQHGPLIQALHCIHSLALWVSAESSTGHPLQRQPEVRGETNAATRLAFRGIAIPVCDSGAFNGIVGLSPRKVEQPIQQKPRHMAWVRFKMLTSYQFTRLHPLTRRARISFPTDVGLDGHDPRNRSLA